MKNDVLDIIIEETLHEMILSEMGMKSSKFSDKYSEIVGSVTDNLVALCMYPGSQAVSHWKTRTSGLVKRFIDLNIDPISKNTPRKRFMYLKKGVIETLDRNYEALLNHFKSVHDYYARPENPNGILKPYKPYEICYKENKDKIINAIWKITTGVANQDYNSILEFMENFK